MALDLGPVPNFTPNIPQGDPLGAAQKALQLRQLSGQVALQPLQQQEQEQRLQQQQLATQKEQLEIDSAKAMQKAWSDPELIKKFTGTDAANASGFGFDPNAMTATLVQQGVQAKDAMAMTQSFIERSLKMAEDAKNRAQTGEAEAATRDKGYKVLADKIGGILDLPASKAPDALAQLKQDLVKNPKAYAGVPQEDLAHVYAADLEHLPAMATLIGLDGKIADFHKSKAEAAKAQQGVIPEGGGLSPESKQKVDTDIAVASNPTIQAGKVAVATAEGQARANIEAAQARGSNAALAQVPPHLVAPASAAATKAGEEYAQAQSVTQRLNAMMQAARKGNVVSYQVIPEEGTLQITTSQGVHRINQAEIQQYAGGGSLWQRLMGHVGKQLTGESIPKSVLDDMAEIQKIQSDGAKLKYNNSLTTINQTYGANFKPVEMAEMKSDTRSGPPEGATHIGTSSLDGKRYYLDAKGKKLGPAD